MTFNPSARICQSCGMPLEKEEDFGSNVGGSKSDMYCQYCFQNGSFTDPNISVDEMVAKVAGFMAQMQNIPVEQARQTASSFIPRLARWRRG